MTVIKLVVSVVGDGDKVSRVCCDVDSDKVSRVCCW